MKLSALEYKNLRPWLWRWHRRLGLTAALIIVLVTVTGLLLNHTAELSLAKAAVKNTRILSYYGIQTPEFKAFHIGGHWLSGGWLSDEKQSQLYLNNRHIGVCQAQLLGAVEYQGHYWLACQQEVLVFNQQGDLVDTISAAYGLPVPVKAFGFCKTELCLSTEKRQFKLDAEQISFTPYEKEVVMASPAARLPEPLRKGIVQQYMGQGVSWERVLLDLHSGRLFGMTGVWVVDIAALLLLFLALSGFILWYQQYNKKKNRSAD